MNRGYSKQFAWMTLVIAMFLVLLLAISSLAWGAVSIPLQDIARWLLTGDDSYLAEKQRIILWELRVPRILASILVGASLACAGVGYQALFRNPLADSYMIGASSGAALGVSLAILSGLQMTVLGLSGAAFFAMVGSVGTVLTVLLIGSVGHRTSALTLLLAGIAISSLLNAVVSLMMFLNDQKAVAIISWLLGSLASSDWNSVIVGGTTSMVGIIVLGCMTRQMDAFMLGDIASQSLGLSLFRFRTGVIVGASFATSAAVASSGIIGFVGLIAPQAARLLVGPRHVLVMPMSACLGALTMLLADLLARTVLLPAELPVGIVTALLGCPFFLVLLMSRSIQRQERP